MTSKTVAALTTEITNNFPDNTTGLITPALLRQVTQDTVDSYPNLNSSNVVTNAMMAQMPARTLKGNNTTGTGNATDLTQFTLGAGTYAFTANYGAGVTNTSALTVSGSIAVPTTSADAVLIVQKNSAVTGLLGASNPNPAGYFSLTKNTNGADRGVALFAEAQDLAGSNAGFIEGIRGHAVLSGGAAGEAFAGEFTASAVGVTYTSLMSMETSNFNSSGVDAPATFNGTAPPTLAVGYLTGADGANFSDVGFLVNPYSVNKYRRGFVVGDNSVDQVAFQSYATTVTGIDLSTGVQSFAALAIGNNTPIRALNQSGASALNIMIVDTGNNLVLGTDADVTITKTVANTTTQVSLGNGANNNIAITSSRVRIVGPTGVFSVSGFAFAAGVQDGQRLYLFNSVAFAMTITNDATSTGANRILTLTGGDVVLRAGTSFATFSYDAAATRWILESTNGP